MSDAPPWLDLDQIVPPELKEQLRTMAANLAELEPTVRMLANGSKAIRDAYNEATRAAGVPDGMSDLLLEVSGYDAMFDAWMRLIGYACDVTESVPV